LEQLGLVAAVRGLCKELSQHHGLDVEFTHTDVPEVIPHATALCLYRISQEAIRNVVKHSSANRARVELTGMRDGICLCVVDAGIGFDPSSPGDRGGLGLVSMRERLNLVGGTIRIESRPGGGTRIEVWVPPSHTTETDECGGRLALNGETIP
jgi:signal transduction histidine kinase